MKISQRNIKKILNNEKNFIFILIIFFVFSCINNIISKQVSNLYLEIKTGPKNILLTPKRGKIDSTVKVPNNVKVETKKMQLTTKSKRIKKNTQNFNIITFNNTLQDSTIHKRLIKFKTDLPKDIANDISINFKSNTILFKFNNDYFNHKEYKLKETMKEKLKSFYPLLIKSLEENNFLKDNINFIKIMGMSSPISESNKRNRTSYNKKLAKKRARSIYQFLFNSINNIPFSNPNLALKKTKVSGNGLRFLAKDITRSNKEESLQIFCSTYNCEKVNGVLFKIYTKGQ